MGVGYRLLLSGSLALYALAIFPLSHHCPLLVYTAASRSRSLTGLLGFAAYILRCLSLFRTMLLSLDARSL